MLKPQPTSIRLSRMKEIGNLLSHEIGKSHLNFKQLVAATGLCSSTISRMYYRETRFPRIQTVIKLLEQFGYIVIAQKKQMSSTPPHQVVHALSFKATG